MDYWVARDEDDILYLYNAEPSWLEDLMIFTPSDNNECMIIEGDIHPEFADLKAGEKHPVNLTITLKEKK